MYKKLILALRIAIKLFVFVPKVFELSYCTIRSSSEAMTAVNGSKIVIIERKEESQQHDNNIDLGNKSPKMD